MYEEIYKNRHFSLTHFRPYIKNVSANKLSLVTYIDHHLCADVFSIYCFEINILLTLKKIMIIKPSQLRVTFQFFATNASWLRSNSRTIGFQVYFNNFWQRRGSWGTKKELPAPPNCQLNPEQCANISSVLYSHNKSFVSTNFVNWGESAENWAYSLWNIDTALRTKKFKLIS